MQKLFLIALSVLALAAIPEDSQAKERYALLVGVGRYPNLPDSLRLNGPPNDVRLMREYLTKKGNFLEDHITCLTDDGPQQPSYANIIAELENLKAKLTSGDFALLYFSGHGSQQPDRPGPDVELDGYDEIFLPTDVKGWNKGKHAVENSIADDKIAEFIRAYRRKGADVWVVFDSCHSGTMTREASEGGTRIRQVPPKYFGIPKRYRRIDTSTFTDISTKSPVFGPGALIQFFASQADQVALEMPLPLGVAESEQEVLGIFTYSLLSVLNHYRDMSYNDLAQMIIAKYKKHSTKFTSTPQFSGTNMNLRVFDRNLEYNPAFRATLDSELKYLTVERAGKLHGFGIGAKVSIHSNVVDKSSIGTGVVTGATLTESTIAPDWKEDAAVPKKDWQPVHIRLVQPAYTPTVLISEIETVRDADNRHLHDIIDVLKKDNIPWAEFSTYNSSADYLAAFFDDKFWLLRPGQTLPCSAQRITEEKRLECERTWVPEPLFWSEPDSVSTLVSRAVRARNLVKLQLFSSVPATLKLEVEIERKNSMDPSGNPNTKRFLLSEQKGLLKAGDRVYVKASNESRLDAWGIFSFYVDSKLGITPRPSKDQPFRIEKKRNNMPILIGEISNRTIGTESLVIIAERVRDGRESNYNFFTQKRYEKIDIPGKYDQGLSSSRQLIMEDVWDGGKNASFLGMDALQNKGSQTHVKVFTWRVER